MRNLILGTLLLLVTSLASAGHYSYTGKGVVSKTSNQQLKAHVCLAFAVFLEARGDGELSQMFHAMSIINRVRNPVRWSNDVCSVILEPAQFEPIKGDERRIVNQVKAGNVSAVDNYIRRNFKDKRDQTVWNEINQMTFSMVTLQEIPSDWLHADHFYAPKVLRKRKQPVPNWVTESSLIAVAGNTHFLASSRYIP